MRKENDVVPMRAQIPVLMQWIGRLWMNICGWKIEADPFPGDRFVLIGAPHTSNMDFIFMLATAYSLKLKLHWIGKHTLFKPPFGWVLERLGGIPVDRRQSHGVVEEVASRIRELDEFILVITPPGTRKRTEHWKSGFYWIATRASVPIVCGSMDYSKKQIRLGGSFLPEGDVSEDMERIRAFFEGVQGRFPHKQTTIQLREESNRSDHLPA